MKYGCVKCGSVFEDHFTLCHGCGSFGSIIPESCRPADMLWRERIECESAAALVKKTFDVVSSGSYPDLKLGRKSVVALYGTPGAGKSTMLMKLLDGIEGNVLMVSLEEGIGDTLVSKLKWLEIIRDDFKVAYVRSVQELGDILDRITVSAIGVDSLSVSTLLVDDMRRIANTYMVPVIFTLHVTKDHDPAGSMRTIHDADIVISVSEGKYQVEKSRFGKAVCGGVL